MDPALVSALVQGGATIIGLIGQAIAGAAKGEDPAPLLAEAHRLLGKLAGRESAGGDAEAGTWDKDLAERLRRGAPPVRPRLPVDIELGDMPAGVMLPSRLPGNPFDGGDE